MFAWFKCRNVHVHIAILLWLESNQNEQQVRGKCKCCFDFMNKAHFSWLFYGFDEIVQQSCWLALEWNVKFQRYSYVGIWWLIWCWTSNSRITWKIGVHCRIYSEHLGIILNNSILSPSVAWIFLFGEFTLAFCMNFPKSSNFLGCQ